MIACAHPSPQAMRKKERNEKEHLSLTDMELLFSIEFITNEIDEKNGREE